MRLPVLNCSVETFILHFHCNHIQWRRHPGRQLEQALPCARHPCVSAETERRPAHPIGRHFGPRLCLGQARLLMSPRTDRGGRRDVTMGRVLDEELPRTGERLPPDWALQNLADWLTGLGAERHVAGAILGLWFGILVSTSPRDLATTAAGTPLCGAGSIDFGLRLYVLPKLWKHHAQARRFCMRLSRPWPGAMAASICGRIV